MKYIFQAIWDTQNNSFATKKDAEDFVNAMAEIDPFTKSKVELNNQLRQTGGLLSTAIEMSTPGRINFVKIFDTIENRSNYEQLYNEDSQQYLEAGQNLGWAFVCTACSEMTEEKWQEVIQLINNTQV